MDQWVKKYCPVVITAWEIVRAGITLKYLQSMIIVRDTLWLVVFLTVLDNTVFKIYDQVVWWNNPQTSDWLKSNTINRGRMLNALNDLHTMTAGSLLVKSRVGIQYLSNASSSLRHRLNTWNCVTWWSKHLFDNSISFFRIIIYLHRENHSISHTYIIRYIIIYDIYTYDSIKETNTYTIDCLHAKRSNSTDSLLETTVKPLI